MQVELARTRLRGFYATLAGALLLLGAPLLQSALFASPAYTQAIQQVTLHGDYRLYLLWLGQRFGAYLVYSLVELVAFLLALTLPGTLQRALWPLDERRRRGGALPTFLGQAGFALFALEVALRVIAARNAVGAPSLTPAVTADFANAATLDALISRTLGGGLLALWLVLLGRHIMRMGLLGRWPAYLAFIVAALLAASAIFTLFGDASAENALAGVAVPALAVWLGVIGVVLLRLRALPAWTLAYVWVDEQGNQLPEDGDERSDGADRSNATQSNATPANAAPTSDPAADV